MLPFPPLNEGEKKSAELGGKRELGFVAPDKDRSHVLLDRDGIEEMAMDW